MSKPFYGLLIVLAGVLAGCSSQAVNSPTKAAPVPGSSPSSTAEFKPATPGAARTAAAETLSPSATPAPTATATPLPPPIRVMRVDYRDMTTSRKDVDAYEKNMQAAGINMVSLGGGRVEWNYFKWSGHETRWASSVRDTGIDFLAEDSARFGKWAKIDVSVDVLSPNYILAHPRAAAINFYGGRSSDLVSTNELVNGQFGKDLLSMIEFIAANYPVDSISLTELFYHSDGYGADDKALYLAYSGQKDWPRKSDGSINIDDASIGNWRTHALDVYLDQAVAICHQHGKQFFLDVVLSLDNLSHLTNEHGTNYKVVLEHTDKLVIWAYYDLDHFPPELFKQIDNIINRFGQDRVILSLGLWDEALPQSAPQKFKTYLSAAENDGIRNFWITPGTLMTAAHWKILDDFWGPSTPP